MEPPGNRVTVHYKTDNQTSWGHHDTPGWYIGPYFDHYRCMQCYMPATGIVIITGTLQYIPKEPPPKKQPHMIIYNRPLET